GTRQPRRDRRRGARPPRARPARHRGRRLQGPHLARHPAQPPRDRGAALRRGPRRLVGARRPPGRLPQRHPAVAGGRGRRLPGPARHVLDRRVHGRPRLPDRHRRSGLPRGVRPRHPLHQVHRHQHPQPRRGALGGLRDPRLRHLRQDARTVPRVAAVPRGAHVHRWPHHDGGRDHACRAGAAARHHHRLRSRAGRARQHPRGGLRRGRHQVGGGPQPRAALRRPRHHHRDDPVPRPCARRGGAADPGRGGHGPPRAVRRPARPCAAARALHGDAHHHHGLVRPARRVPDGERAGGHPRAPGRRAVRQHRGDPVAEPLREEEV
ncbi:MAG: Phosphate transport system permease protein PstA, partial [uncultured Acidimicrobiales bacterium]